MFGLHPRIKGLKFLGRYVCSVCILPIKLICYTYLILSLLSPSKYTKFAGSLTTPLLQVWCGSPVSLFSTDFLIQKAARTIESEPTPAAFLGVRTISCFHTGKGYLHDKATWTQICLKIHKVVKLQVSQISQIHFASDLWEIQVFTSPNPDSQIGLETLPATRGKQNKTMKSKVSWLQKNQSAKSRLRRLRLDKERI